MSRLRTVVFASILASAMASSTFAVNSIGVLASTLIGELGLTRSQVGGLVSAFAAFAAGFSIPAGRITDRIGGRNGLAIVFAGSALGLVSVGLAPGYTMLLMALALGGLANSGANPGTNHLIAEHLEPGKRGVITGIKMSGVQLGVFVAGVVLPVGIRTIGWRPSLMLLATLPAIWAIVLLRFLPSGHRDSHAVDRHPLPGSVWILAGYTFLMSVATTAIITYIPLFAEESIGLTLAGGGLAVALSGVMSVPGRIVWGRHTEHTARLGVPLIVTAGAAAVAVTGLVAADTGSAGLLWVSVVAFGLTGGSYNAAATMVLIRSVPPARTGRASGVVFTGFLGGLAVGPLVFGRVVDATGGYRLSLAAVVGVFVACAFIALAGFGASKTE